jgi:hypothetical protein|tara:strand:- start:5 stop:148 length:144 start_codon:yes stop_codon:yes gene_type:complete
MEERFFHFISNDWVHMERKVSALEAKVHLLLGGVATLIGLVVYTVIE